MSGAISVDAISAKEKIVLTTRSTWRSLNSGYMGRERMVDASCVVANPVTISLCADDPQTDVELDLTAEEANILGGQDPSGLSISYYQ